MNKSNVYWIDLPRCIFIDESMQYGKILDLKNVLKKVDLFKFNFLF